MRVQQRYVIFTLFLVGLSSCMVGPNFHRPNPPRLPTYNAHPLPAKTVATKEAGKGGIAQYYHFGADLGAAWWEMFHSPSLNNLIYIGITNSPTLVAAKAALIQARENLAVQVGNSLLPAFNLQSFASRQLGNGGAGTTPGTAGSSGLGAAGAHALGIFNLFNTQVNVSYVVDVFGGARRQIESLQAQMDFQRFELIAAYLTLTSNIATTAINIASLEAQIQAQIDLIRLEQNSLTILRKQYALGGIALGDVLTQETLVAQTKGSLPPLRRNLAAARHALATLLGIFPNSPLPRINLNELTLPAHLPVSLPSDLARQRPDILAAEATLHAASANIGVATANLFPQFTITGAYGWTALVPNQLFTPQSHVWNIMAAMTQPIFHGGALLAQRRASIAAYQQAAAQYRQTVLQGLQNVADSLRAIETSAQALKEQKIAEIASKKSLTLAQQQYTLGGITYLNLLIAQQQYERAHIARIVAQAGRYTDTVALFQSLGGGWWESTYTRCRKPTFMENMQRTRTKCINGEKSK